MTAASTTVSPDTEALYETWWYALAIYRQLCGTREQASSRDQYLKLSELCWEAKQSTREAWRAYEAASTGDHGAG